MRRRFQIATAAEGLAAWGMRIDPAPQDSSPSLQQGWWCLIGAVLLIYGQVIFHRFTNFDDNSYITHNAHVTSGLTWQTLRWAFTGDVLKMWHPLTALSHIVDWQIFGAAAGGHLAINTLLHALNAGLLFTVLRGMTGAGWPSFLVALLFAVHPLNVESVAWASQRKTTLSGLFFMLTLLAWTRYKMEDSRRAYGGSLIFFAAGLMSKPVLVTLPCLLLLFELWPFSRFRDRRTPRELARVFLDKIPFGLLAIGAVAMNLDPSVPSAATGADAAFSVERWWRAVANTEVYLRKVVWPVDLAVLYPQRPIVSAAELRLAVAVLGVVTLFSFIAGWPTRIGWLWFIGLLFPMSGIVPIGPHELADRYAYLSTIGIFILVAWSIPRRLWSGPRWQAISLVALGGLAFGAMAWRQVGFWKDSVTLWTRATQLYPPSAVQLLNFGQALAEAKRYDEAERCFADLIRAMPQAAPAYVNLASIRNERGDRSGAIVLLQQAILAEPTHARAHALLGSYLHDAGRSQEALAELQAALRLAPDLASAHVDLGVLHAQGGELNEAKKHFEAALRLDPNDPIAQRNLALLRRQLQMPAAAGKRP